LKWFSIIFDTFVEYSWSSEFTEEPFCHKLEELNAAKREKCLKYMVDDINSN